MIEAYKAFWMRAFDFKGRSTRADFWWVVLASFIISFVLGFVLGILGLGYSYTFDVTKGLVMTGSKVGYTISMLWSLANIIPNLALYVRRFHDINKSGWLLLLMLIPVVNFVVAIVFFIFTLLPSVNEGNKYNN